MKIENAIRDKILTDIQNDWNARDAWSLSQNLRNDARHAYRKIKKSIEKRITDMKAKDIIDSLIDNGGCSLMSVEMPSKMKGLNIKNDPRKVVEVEMESCGSEHFTSIDNLAENNDL